MARTTNILNFRETPGGKVFGAVRGNALLTAFMRVPGWFYVDYHGERGWISADFVAPVGRCG